MIKAPVDVLATAYNLFNVRLISVRLRESLYNMCNTYII